MASRDHTAAALEAIREEIADLKRRLDLPSHRQQLRETALDDKEVPDPIPHALFEDQQHGPETIQEQIARYVRFELSQVADEQELETFQEADNFDEDDFDELPASLFEVTSDLEVDPEMPRIEDADDSRAIPEESSSLDEPPAEGVPPQQPAASSVVEDDSQ